MLKIRVPDGEFFNNHLQEFRTVKGQTIQLEHSLISLSRWESKWKKPFLDGKEKTRDESIDYIRCMSLTKGVDPLLYASIPGALLNKIFEYVYSQRTATTFKNTRGGGSKEVVTSELIYFWMIYHGVPIECEKWHLSRLLALIRICDIKQGPQQKMSRNDIFSQNRSLNAARKRNLRTSG